MTDGRNNSTTSTSKSKMSQKLCNTYISDATTGSPVDIDCDRILLLPSEARARVTYVYCSREFTQKGLIYGRKAIPWDWAKSTGLSVHWYRAQVLRFLLRPRDNLIMEVEKRMIKTLSQAKAEELSLGPILAVHARGGDKKVRHHLCI